MPVRTALGPLTLAAAAAAAIIASAGPAHAQATPAAPQSATPIPLPPGAGADTPGGAARNGVIAPPDPTGDAAINRGAPAATVGAPVIPPPGSPGGNPALVPK